MNVWRVLQLQKSSRKSAAFFHINVPNVPETD